MQNIDTGEFERINKDEDVKPPWRLWSVDELIEIKGGLFQVIGINTKNDMVLLKGRNKQARKPLKELFENLNTSERETMQEKLSKVLKET